MRLFVPHVLGAADCKGTEETGSAGLGEHSTLVQVPVADDGPPVATADTFAVALGRTSLLYVLTNDTAAYGSLALTSVTSGNFGDTSLCANMACVEYTASSRFSGWDSFTYTAEDQRGRLTNATARVRASCSLFQEMAVGYPAVLFSYEIAPGKCRAVYDL